MSHPSSPLLSILLLPLLLLSLTLLPSLPPTSAQTASVFPNSTDLTELWEQNFNALRSGGVASSVLASAIDPNDGSLVVVGYATGALLSHVSAGGLDAFAVKLDPRSGQLIWTRWYATTQEDVTTGVCIDAAGNVFLVGSTAGSLMGLTQLGGRDVFMVKLTADGTQLWIRQVGSGSDDLPGTCAVDVYGALYLVGQSVGWYLGSGSYSQWSIFVGSYASADGSKLWGRNLGATAGGQYLYYGSSYGNWPNAGYNGNVNLQNINGHGLSIINPIANVSSAPLLIVSCFLDAAAVFPDAPANPAGGYDSVVAAYYSSNGSLAWAVRYASNGDDIVFGTATDSSGSTYAVGYTTSNLDGGLYTLNADIFVGKTSITGHKLWTRVYGTTLNEVATGVAVDNAGGVYVTGFTQVSPAVVLDHAPSPFAATFITASANTGYYSEQSGFLSKFDSDGARLWTDLFEPGMPLTQQTAYPPSITPNTISFDPTSQQLYISGKKSGYLNTDGVQTALSQTDLFEDETFTIAAVQQPTNCTLLQFDTLLSQINNLLLGL